MAEHLVRNRQTFFEREERLFARLSATPTTSVSKCSTHAARGLRARASADRTYRDTRRLPCRSSCHHANGMAAVRCARRCRDGHASPLRRAASYGTRIIHHFRAAANDSEPHRPCRASRPPSRRARRARPDRARPVSTYSAPPAATSGAASAIARSSAARSSNGGSRNTTSNAPGVSWPRAAARPPRQPRPHARRACPDRTQLLRGARMALDHHDARRAARRRLETECAGAREQVEATPAFEIQPSQLNSVSRTRSGVGRRPSRSSTASGVRFQSPPMMRIVCGLPRPEGPPGGRRGTGHTEYRRRRDRARAGRTAKQAHVTTAAMRAGASATPH